VTDALSTPTEKLAGEGRAVSWRGGKAVIREQRPTLPQTQGLGTRSVTVKILLRDSVGSGGECSRISPVIGSTLSRAVTSPGNGTGKPTGGVEPITPFRYDAYGRRFAEHRTIDSVARACSTGLGAHCVGAWCVGTV
jgi:hypothetical protein